MALKPVKHSVPSAGVKSGMSNASAMAKDPKAIGMASKGKNQTPMGVHKETVKTASGTFNIC